MNTKCSVWTLLFNDAVVVLQSHIKQDNDYAVYDELNTMEKGAVVAYFNAIFWNSLEDAGKNHEGLVSETNGGEEECM
jgi:hypothetical protein